MVETSNTGDGENLFGTCCLGYLNVSDAVFSWYNEVSQYNFTYPSSSPTTGHFTQVCTAPSCRLAWPLLSVHLAVDCVRKHPQILEATTCLGRLCVEKHTCSIHMRSLLAALPLSRADRA